MNFTKLESDKYMYMLYIIINIILIIVYYY